jgi:hypothetical protein
MGHVASGDELLEEQAAAMEQALWTSVRLAAQQALLGRRLARLSRAADDPVSAASFDAQAEMAEQNYQALRNLIEAVRLPKSRG